MKHKRAFKKYLHGGAILTSDDPAEAAQIKKFGAQLGSLSSVLAAVSAKFANQTAQFSTYEQLAAASKQFYDLFLQLVLGQLKYSMHLRDSFLHKAAEVKDIDVTRGQLQQVIDVAKEKVLPAAGTAAAYFVAGTGLPVAAGVGVALYAAPKVMTSIYYNVKTLSTKLTYLVQSYKRYFQSLKNSFYYLVTFQPQTRADMNKLYYAVEGGYKCFLNHTLVLDELQKCLLKMEKYTKPQAKAPELLARFKTALDNCRGVSNTLSATIAQLASHYGYGWQYLETELRNAQVLQNVIDTMILESTAYAMHFETYYKELVLKESKQPPSPTPRASSTGFLQYGTDLPPVRPSSLPPPVARPAAVSPSPTP